MQLFVGDLSVPIHVKRSNRSRRFALRVSRLDGRVTLCIPEKARIGPAQRFLDDHEGWLRNALGAITPPVQVGIGASVPIEGRKVYVQGTLEKSVRLEGNILKIPGALAQSGVRVAAFLKVLARNKLVEASDRHAGALGRSYRSIALRDTRSRWGSCGHNGALMFSWRLVMAPPSVLDYVAAHEVAHLVHMNHAPEFWSLVTDLCPEWKRERDWLRSAAGQELHSYRFA